MGLAEAPCPVLKERLVEISNALLALDTNDAAVMGRPDDMKLKSSMTLFEAACEKMAAEKGTGAHFPATKKHRNKNQVSIIFIC